MDHELSVELGDTIGITATVVGIKLKEDGKVRYELHLQGNDQRWDTVFVGEEVIELCKKLT